MAKKKTTTKKAAPKKSASKKATSKKKDAPKKEPFTDEQSVKLIVKSLIKHPDSFLTPVGIKQSILKDAEMFDIDRFIDIISVTGAVEKVPYISKGSFKIKAKNLKSLKEMVK